MLEKAWAFINVKLTRKICTYIMFLDDRFELERFN